MTVPYPASIDLPAGSIRVGIGGWNFPPWRSNFYPAGLPQSRELEYASRQLRVLEIDSTYYGSQKPSTFARWHDETPEDFVFTVKASRYATNRRVLAEAGESIDRFVGSLTELKGKLGPLLWQFATFKRFDAADFDTFLQRLPRELNGRPLRHAMDVRHESFRCAEYLELARRHGVATVFTDSDDYPPIPDLTGDFVYSRVMRTDPTLGEGYPPAVLDGLADCARAWRDGGEPTQLPRVEAAPAPSAMPAAPRDVFVFFISVGKERAPAAAMALQRRI